MGILDFNVIGQISGLIIVIVLAAGFGYLLWKHKDESTAEAESNRKIYAVVFGALLLLLVVQVWPGTPASSTSAAHQLSGVLTLSPTATASCYAFSPAGGFSLLCNKQSGSYQMVTTNNGTNGAGASTSANILTKYSTNAMYVGGTTTATNEYGLSITVRRNDPDFQAAACAGPCKASVSFSISDPTSWAIKSNTSSIFGANQYLLAQDSLGNYMIGWTDTTPNTVVGATNAGGLMSLTGNGNSATVKLAFVFNQIALPRNVPSQTYQFQATITVTMSFQTLADGTSATPVTWSIPLTVNYQAAAA